MESFVELEYRSRNRELLKIKNGKEILDKENLGKMKLFYQSLKLSRRQIYKLIKDLFDSYYGTYQIYDGKKCIKFSFEQKDIDAVFGVKVEDDIDDELYSTECRFISDWLNQPLPKQNGHKILLPRFRFMWMAMQLYLGE